MLECLFTFLSFFSEKNCSTIEKHSAISEFQLHSHFQNEAKCKTFLVKMSFIRMRINCMKMLTYINGFTLSLALKQRLEATQKWPIKDEHLSNRKRFPCLHSMI